MAYRKNYPYGRIFYKPCSFSYKPCSRPRKKIGIFAEGRLRLGNPSKLIALDLHSICKKPA